MVWLDLTLKLVVWEACNCTFQSYTKTTFSYTLNLCKFIIFYCAFMSFILKISWTIQVVLNVAFPVSPIPELCSRVWGRGRRVKVSLTLCLSQIDLYLRLFWRTSLQLVKIVQSIFWWFGLVRIFELIRQSTNSFMCMYVQLND